MSRTSDTSNLFQSDAQHNLAAYRAAKSTLHVSTGDPIQLASRPLRVVVKQTEGKEADAWAAESGFVLRRVGLESGKTKQLYKGHLGPVTSLDFYTVPSSPPREVLVSGSWDKSFRVWDTQTKNPISTTIAHTDFVKTLLVIPSLSLLVTGSSDKDLRIWDLLPLSSPDFTPSPTDSALAPAPPKQTGAAPPAATPSSPLPLLFSLKSHIRPVERLASYELYDEEGGAPNGHIALISVDSMGCLKVWELWREADGSAKGELRSESRPHEIGIYDLVVTGDGELWTASADHSILLSTFSPVSSVLKTPPTPSLRIPFPTPLKSVLPLPLAFPSLNLAYILVGSSDEKLRIIDYSELRSPPPGEFRGLPSEKESEGLQLAIEGHSHEVIELKGYTVVNEEGRKEAWVVSASVDGTLRRWNWDRLKKGEYEVKGIVVEEEEEEQKEGLLTEEEERELEELMADD